MSTNLVPVEPGELQSSELLPALIRDSGKAALSPRKIPSTLCSNDLRRS